MLRIYDGALDIPNILQSWYITESHNNYGAFIPFVGTIRDEDGIDGLSFDIYEPLLVKWFISWQERAKTKNAIIKMAHSRGDVLIHESSYIACIFAPRRRVALELIDAFVEDFKAYAPIWKYDLKDSKRIYALERSTPIKGSGLLA